MNQERLRAPVGRRNAPVKLGEPPIGIEPMTRGGHAALDDQVGCRVEDPLDAFPAAALHRRPACPEFPLAAVTLRVYKY
jgi:hypothetical protein